MKKRLLVFALLFCVTAALCALSGLAADAEPAELTAEGAELTAELTAEGAELTAEITVEGASAALRTAPLPGDGEKPLALPPEGDRINAARVDYVWINISEPTIGGEPDYTPEYGASSKVHSYSESYSSLYYKNDVSWYDETDGRSLEPDKDTFVQWHEYTVIIYVTAKKGYEYDDATYAYVNGAKVECTLYGDQLHIRYTFPPAGIIPEAKILWIKPPIAGNTPDYEPTVTDGDRYYLADYSSGNTFKNDIVWRDVTTNKHIAVTDTFIAGHQYEITVYYTAKEGYVFTDKTTGKISPSGGPYFSDTFETEARMYNDQLCLTYTFPATPRSIDEVLITCTPPFLGKNPDYDPVVSPWAPYEIYDYNSSEYTHGVWWYDMQTKKVLHASDTFSAPDHEYRIALWIKPKDGYTFNGPGYVNGIKAAVSNYWNGMRLYCVSFYGVTQEITAASATITPPKAGEKPDVNPKLPSGAKYMLGNPYSDDSFSNVKWYDTAASTEEIDPQSYTFKPGHSYGVNIFLKPAEGYVFSESGSALNGFDAFINGEDAGSLRLSAQTMIISCTFPALPEKTLSSIKVTKAPTKTTYIEGEKFSKSGMEVTASYSDGTTAKVTDYTFKPTAALKTTDTKVTISYTENGVTKTATQAITVKAKTLTGIKVTTAPTKTTYIEGEKFSKTGMVVTASYDNGTTAKVTDYTFKPTTALKTTDTKVTISYTENGVTMTTTQKITVKAKTLTGIKITTPPTKTNYTEGEKFSKTGMVVTASYDNGTTAKVTDYTFKPTTALKTTDTKITISYTENGVTKTATQAITVKAKSGTVLRGDVNGDGKVNSNDAIHLLRHTMNSDRFPINQSGDMNGDGKVNSNDAIHLLRYTMSPDRFPLKG